MHGACLANTLKTHCPAGHELTGVNLLKSRDGSRNCRECHLAALKRYRQKQKELVYE